jgi:hypothetical protein
MSQTKAQKQTVNTVFTYLALICAVLLLGLSGVAMWANRFTGDMVRNELAAQKIFFPEKGSPALDPAVYPDLQKYAGQQVDTPEEAHAYANGYIGRHLKKVADGKVYSEISTLAIKDPTNQKLQQQKQTLFQGETLRGILLTSGYGFGTIGKIAGIVTYLALAGSALLFVTAGLLHFKRRS